MKVTVTGFIVASLGCPWAAGKRSHGVRGIKVQNEQRSSVVCRLLHVATMKESANGEIIYDDETACIPIIYGQESDDVVPLLLPEDMYEATRMHIVRGEGYVEITNAQVVSGDIALKADSEFLVIDSDHAPSRSLQVQATMGTKTVAIVRISTADSIPTVTTKQLEDMFDVNTTAFPLQYRKCSFGKLQWELAEAGVIDVQLDQPVADFGTGPRF